MNFMDILKEAKDPNPTNINVDDDATNDATDYNADIDDAVSDEDTTDNTDTEETEQEDGQEDDASDADETEDEPTDEESPEPDESEPTDYTEEISEIQPEEESEEQTTEDPPADDSTDESGDTDTPKQNMLLNDFVELYSRLHNNIDKFDKIKSLDMMTRSVINRVKTNLTTISDYTFIYTTTVFKKKTYTENLYTYNYIVQLYKICIQMLSKINEFNSDT